VIPEAGVIVRQPGRRLEVAERLGVVPLPVEPVPLPEQLGRVAARQSLRGQRLALAEDRHKGHLVAAAGGLLDAPGRIPILRVRLPARRGGVADQAAVARTGPVHADGVVPPADTTAAGCRVIIPDHGVLLLLRACGWPRGG